MDRIDAASVEQIRLLLRALELGERLAITVFGLLQVLLGSRVLGRELFLTPVVVLGGA